MLSITLIDIFIGTQDENVLQELNIEIRSNADCGSIWPSHHIHDSHICVGYGSSGACNVSFNRTSEINYC